MRHVIPAIAMVALAACGGSRTEEPRLAPVRLEGRTLDLRELAGEWQGEFYSDSTRRHGTIAFSLRGGRDSAYGRVVIEGAPLSPACGDAVSAATHRQVVARIVLTIGRVMVSEGSVGGWLQPYRDPERGCWLDTWFEGEFEHDSLGGMYFSRPADTDGDAVHWGTWWAVRKR